ncbi:SIMPL domain-containing protein [Nocardioides sp. HDW12B]|uniref:SIMPL domain-containing protein n=1 Tax=Nocardioides sp. HDW12B TaxID=2714939 RepID=UPI001409E1D4|nr:SIMPL domain-containing protein [Nocardioides sp. HDW12B]QIK65517.1 SIMPL domain-containing protein [Nocardioides sp. HDW12B]
MNTSVTVSLRALVAAVLVLLVVVAAYLLGGAGSTEAAATPVPAAATASARDLARGQVPGTLTMTGEGEAVGVPHQLAFRVAVTRKEPTVPAAMDAASRTMGRVLAALERAGVERKDVQSTGLSVDPVYDYVDYRPPVLTGYRVNQSVSVLVRDLGDGGEAISTATRTGGNAVRVSGIGLRIGDKDALLATARDAAVEAATAKAEQYAAATGQELGTVLTLTEGREAVAATRDQVRGYELARMAADSAGANMAVPIRAGREDLAVNVSIVWQLVPAAD